MSFYDKAREPDPEAFFSDTTADYLSPAWPALFSMVEIRLRVGKGEVDSCFLVLADSMFLHMHPVPQRP